MLVLVLVHTRHAVCVHMPTVLGPTARGPQLDTVSVQTTERQCPEAPELPQCYAAVAGCVLVVLVPTSRRFLRSGASSAWISTSSFLRLMFSAAV